MINESAIRSLEKLMNSASFDETLFPIKHGKTIFIKNYEVEFLNNCYYVRKHKEKTVIAKTFCKASAIAIAKTLAKNKNIVRRILELDKIIEKNFHDAMFYRHILKGSASYKNKEIREIRLSEAIEKTRAAKEKLDKYIFIN